MFPKGFRIEEQRTHEHFKWLVTLYLRKHNEIISKNDIRLLNINHPLSAIL